MLALVLCMAMDIYFEPFTKADESELKGKQVEILKRIKDSPGTSKYEVFKLDPDIVNHDSFVFKVVGDELRFKDCNIEKEDDRIVIRYDDGGGKIMSLRIKDNAPYGLIYYKSKVYGVESLGGGYVAIILLRQIKFKDHPDE